jgi:hypothetical protein
MTFSLRHIILLTGIFTVIISFLWFGRDTETYNIILLIGIAVSLISFLTIIIKSDSRKSKGLWILVVLVSIGVQWLTEPLLIKLSYRIFINKHDKELTSVTKLLASKKGNVFMTPSSELWTRNGYTKEESNQINNELRNTGIHFITKDSIKIYYRTWGMLDISHGVYYFYTDAKSDNRYSHIMGNWYY